MRSFTKETSVHTKSRVTTFATLWKVTRRDGVVFGYTDAVEDVPFEGLIYKAGGGFTASAMEQSAKFNVEHMSVDGFTPIGGIDDVDITDNDLLDGKFDFASVEINQVNYLKPTDGAVKLLKGRMGQFELKKNQFVVELVSLGAAAQHQIGQIYSVSCRAKLGDVRCKVPLIAQAQSQLIQLADKLVTGDTITVDVDGRDTNDIVTTIDLKAGDSMFVKIDGVELTQVFATNNNTTLDQMAAQIELEPNVLTATRTSTRTIRVTSIDDETLLQSQTCRSQDHPRFQEFR